MNQVYKRLRGLPGPPPLCELFCKKSTDSNYLSPFGRFFTDFSQALPKFHVTSSINEANHMFHEVLRIWSFVPGIVTAIWYGGFNAARYGWSLGRKTFFLHYLQHVKSPQGNH